MHHRGFSIPASPLYSFYTVFGTCSLYPSIFVDHTIFCEKGAFTGFYHINFGGLLFSSAATNFAAVILNVNTEWRGGSAARTAYGYRDRLRIGNNSNISRDNISFDPIENCKCFHLTDKIVVHSRALGYFYSARSLSFLIDIVKSNAIFVSFIATVAFVCFSMTVAAQ